MIDFFKRLFSKEPAYLPLESGFHSYHSPKDDPEPYRLHLRIEPNGEGVLIVNASSVLHLNQTAAEFAYYLIKGKQDDEITRLVSERFSAPTETIAADVALFRQQARSTGKSRAHQYLSRHTCYPCLQVVRLSTW